MNSPARAYPVPFRRPQVLRGTERRGFATLTPREREVLESWIKLGNYLLVAHDLRISLHTVKNNATRIVAKLEARSFGQAAVIYDRWAVGRFERDRRVNPDRRKDERRRHE